MKRYILIIGVILFSLVLRAQSVTYTCRYWFDQDDVQTTTFSEGTWQTELDVGSLSDGLHFFHLHVMDTSMKWCPPQSFLFLKIPAMPSAELEYRYWFDQDHAAMQSGALGNGYLLLDVDGLSSGLHSFHVMLKGTEYSASQSYLFLKTDTTGEGGENLVYHCWFDQDYDNQQSDVLGNGQLLLDVANLEEGLHSVHVMLEGNALTATQSYMFMKVASFTTDSIDMSHLAYHCWFDQDYEHQQTDSLGDGNLLLDVNGLEDGLHTVHVMLEGGALTSPLSYMFMKVAVQNPSTELQYHCWFDQDYSHTQTGLLGNGLFELEVGDLPNGLHTVNVMLDNGTLTSPQTYLFYKIPLGGFGVARWEYWLNDDFANRITTDMSPFVDTLEIISLLSVGHPDIRSSCFHFHPNGDEPYINAKNEIKFRIWDTETRFMDISRFYVDQQVQQSITAEVFERNTTETFAAPHQIQWFKLDAVVGDSLAFVANKACTMQLFAPSGEEVFNVSGSESIELGGLHAWEDGTYYLAVHDQTGSGETVSVTYQYVHKYAVLAYDVHLVGNGGCSTITFQGNGFNSLLDAYLVNAQNDTIRRLDIGHESNTTTTVTFNFYQVNLGVYDAVFEFYDETVRVNGALEVQEPVDIVLTSSVSYPSQFLRNTPCTYTFTITNEGNMTAYNVPIYTYIGTSTLSGISHIKFDGLNLPSIIDDISLDSLSTSDIDELKEWAIKMGDDWCFYKFRTRDDNSGDSIWVRSNYFFQTLAPYETKTISLKITATNTIEVWFTIPESIQAFIIPEDTMLENRSSFVDGYCCAREGIECTLTFFKELLARVEVLGMDASVAIAFASAVTGQLEGLGIAAGTLGAAEVVGVINCYVSAAETTTKVIGNTICEGDDDDVSLGDILDAIRKSRSSLEKSIMNCLSQIIPFGAESSLAQHWMQIGEAAESGAGLMYTIRVAINGTEDVDTHCISKFQNKSSDCPGGNPHGGNSTPVNSLDPNDIYGYLSESGSHYMRQEIQNIHYKIEFENDTTLATAAAHTIIVRDTLDATKFDLNSLAAHSVTIGEKRLELNGEQTFARTLDMRPELYVIAQIEQEYDPATGIVAWIIQSLDPMTMEPTDNPYQGVLPVNYYGNGVGFIDYSINLKQAFDDGTEVSNCAGIIFDQEEVIMTPIWTNIVDAVKPTSHIEEATPVADSLNFSFVSSDNRSGVWYHTLYQRNDSTNQQWQVKKAQIFGNSYMLYLEDLQTTEYLVMAVDSAGNVEDKLMNAEYVFGLDSLVYYTLTVSDPQGCGEVHGSGTYVAGSHVTIEAIPDDDCHFLQWNDGITDNPRVVHLVQDTTFVAMFEYDPTGLSQITNFSSGWNWWSSYIELDGANSLQSLQNGLGTSGMMIKSQNDGYASYLAGYGWYGSLTTINNENSYQIRANEPCSVEMTSAMANPFDHPITLNTGWTWVGYPVAVSMGVSEAFSGISPQSSDILKSQNNGFASYLDGFGWYGSLSILQPGMGLMYKSNNGSAVTLVYPNDGTRTDLKANQTADNNHWQPNLNAYPDNMSVMAVVELDGKELALRPFDKLRAQGPDNYELAAFANGEVRGSARLMYVEPLNRYMAFLTVAGDESADLRFSLFNAETGAECHNAEEALTYETNAVVGGFADPYIIHFRNNTGLDEWVNSVYIFPNPVERGQRVSLGLSAEESGEVQVEIINALGTVVETRRAASLQTITAPETAGVYTLRITVEGKGTCYRKLVVE